MWNPLKKMTPLEIIVLIVFIFYLILNIKTPHSISQFIETPLGIIIILMITLWMFIYTNPILGILTIFVAYELVRRGSTEIIKITNNIPRVAMIQPNPVPILRKHQLDEMNEAIDVNPITALPIEPTLEEEVVRQMAPLSSGQPSFMDTGFKPVAENTHNASYITL